MVQIFYTPAITDYREICVNIYNISDINSTTLDNDLKLADKINGIVSRFFETLPLDYSLKIYESQEDLAKSWLSHNENQDAITPKWLVAFTTLNGSIHLMSSKIIPAGHEKNSLARFKKTLRHELSHIYVDKINNRAPSWLKEGVCLYSAKQNYYKKVDFELINTSTLDRLDYNFEDGMAYDIGKTIVDEIVAKFGKNTLFNIIATQDKKDRYDKLKKMFPWFI